MERLLVLPLNKKTKQTFKDQPINRSTTSQNDQTEFMYLVRDENTSGRLKKRENMLVEKLLAE